MQSLKYDLIVVGAGLSGLVAAATAAEAGGRVAVVHGGLGTFVYGAGCIADLPAEGGEEQRRAVAFFEAMTEAAGSPYYGQPGDRHMLPTILGTFQPVSLVPFCLWGGRVQAGARVSVAGIAGLSSFDARFTAERLNQQAEELGLQSRYVPRIIDLPHEGSVPHSTLNIANRFDRDEPFRRLFAERLRAVQGECDQILLPACLGQQTSRIDIEDFQAQLGRPLGELPTLPPSMAGLRLNNRLLGHLRRRGVEMIGGYPLLSLDLADGICRGVVVDNPGRARTLAAKSVVLACGPQSETLLPGWSRRVDARQRPLNDQNQLLAEGIHVAGALLFPTGRRGGNGRAIVSGHAAALMAAGREKSHAA
ncbi:MAG TPA: FAD-binding protein [Candidatus Sulfotelmatobacter sp.]|jgi:glycerol-3-phosphate dehydrogenase subunit B|nr:FAD-binding protein [Candidatus Sulfotelmatobacter sp.]